jgi:hypothetical protein
MVKHMEFEQIRAFLTHQKIYNYHINPDGTIDVNGDVNLRYLGDVLPPYVQFGKVTGEFKCSWSGLTTLRGCPLEVGGDAIFICYYNNLTPNTENFDIIYRCTGEHQLYIDDNLTDAYYNYRRIRKRADSINELLR